MFDTETQKELFYLVEQAVENENFRRCLIRLRSKFENGAIDFIRVGVFGRDHNDFLKFMDLIVKIINIERADKMGITKSLRRAFQREKFMHQTMFPMMELFEQQKYSKYRYDRTIMLCYQCLQSSKGEIAIIFNDLKKINFHRLDPQLPMSVNHIKAVLTQYARYHANFFAMRDQNSEFDEILRDFDPVDEEIFSEGKAMEMIKNGFAKAIKVLGDRNKDQLKQKLEKFAERGISRIIKDVLSNIPDEWVIVHGDGWNENFVFSYKDDKREIISEVCILNWQLSTPHSPVLDLSMFLYFVSSKNELLQFDHLIAFYYEHFCLVMSSIGSDPQKLFPFATLMDHLQRFASYALLLVIAGLPHICSIMVLDQTIYEERVSAVIEHYFSFVNA